MSDFQEGWYGTDEDNHWFFIGDYGQLADYILDLDECEDLVNYIVEDEVSCGLSIHELIEGVVNTALEMVGQYTMCDIVRYYERLYILQYIEVRDIFYIERHIGGAHWFSWATEEDDLDEIVGC